MMRYGRFLSVAAVLAACAVGCKKSQSRGEAENITSMVSVVADAASSEAGLARLFADGDLPPQDSWDRYASFSYKPIGQARVQGDTATIKVRVRQNDKDAGQMEWTFVRQRDQWKLKSAPLP